MLPFYRGKPLLLGSSSSGKNKHGLTAPFSRITSCRFWLVKDGALGTGGSDAVKSLSPVSLVVVDECMSEADRSERGW